MRFGVLGTGTVGQTLGTKFLELGHEVMMGSRTANNAKAQEWAKQAGARARIGTFADAARFAEVVLICTAGAHALDVLHMVDRNDLGDKALVDVSNPQDFSKGVPPTLTICNTDSLGETLQREFPEAKVVKTLNTCNSEVMVNPARIPGEHDLFICGNDVAAKKQVMALLKDFGWKSIIDLGDITNARATEQLVTMWARLFMLYGTVDFNFHIVKRTS